MFAASTHAHADPAPSEKRPAPRRDATAMECAFVSSLILIAAITAIGYFGQQVRKLNAGNGAAIDKALNNNSGTP